MAGKVKEKKSQSTVDKVFEKHRFVMRRNYFHNNQMKVFVLAMMTGFLLVALGFFMSDVSKVKGIQISGNYFLTDEQILEASGINEDSRYLFVFDSVAIDQLCEHPMIQDAFVNVDSKGMVQIEIQEKLIIGYRYKKYPEVIFGDGTIMELSNEYSYLYSQIPLIVGFNDEIDSFAKAFEDVHQKRISSISEIHRYEYSYDPNGLEFVMKDGNRFFASFYSADVINQYNGVASALSEKNVCLFADEHSGNVYKSVCPEIQEALDKLEEEMAEEEQKAEE